MTNNLLYFATYIIFTIFCSNLLGENNQPNRSKFLAEKPIINSDFSNVIFSDKINLSNEAKQILVSNGFVVIPQFNNQIFQYYIRPEIPIFITSDSVLACYGHLIHEAIFELENQSDGIVKNLIEFTNILYLECLKLCEIAPESLRIAADRNLCIVSVVAKLLNIDINIPIKYKDIIIAEINLIMKHSGQAISPILKYRVDYNLFKPRCIYNIKQNTEYNMNQYFQAITFYSLTTFRLISNEETESALLLACLLDSNPILSKLHRNISDFISNLSGKPDDCTIEQYINLSKAVFGEILSDKALSDKHKIKLFTKEASNRFPDPITNSMCLSSEENNKNNKITKGMRIFPLGVPPWSKIFADLSSIQEEIYMPSGLDIFASLGNPAAFKIQLIKNSNRLWYKEKVILLRTKYSEITRKYGNSLTEKYINTISSIWDENDLKVPYFMSNDAWRAKQLNASLASWVEFSHATFHYNKAEYCVLGLYKNLSGFVEPVPDFYQRLKKLSCSSRELFGKVKENDFKEFEKTCEMLYKIAQKEIRNEELTKEEEEFIKNYGKRIASFHGYTENEALSPDRCMSQICDVFTEAGILKKCLEVGTGPAMKILVVVNVDGQPVLTQGGVYSYFEFEQPMERRLTDDEWQKMNKPKLMDWQYLYTTREK